MSGSRVRPSWSWVCVRPGVPAAAGDGQRAAPGFGPYTSSAMHVTTTPSEKSTLVVEVELPVDQVARAVADATRRLSQRTRVAGFRPGKAPRGMLERVLGEGAVWDEAVETLVDTSYARVGQEHGRRRVDRDHRPAGDRARRIRGGEAAPVQGDRPAAPRGQAGRLRQLPVQARDRDGRRCQGGAGRGRPARPAGDAGPRRGPRRCQGRLGRRRLRGDAGRRAVRRRDLRPDAARHRRGAPHPGLRGAPRGPAAGRDGRLRHHVPRRLPGGVAARRPGPLQRGPQGAPREDPAGGGRRLRPVGGRLRRHGGAPGRGPPAPGEERPGPGAPRLRRPDHRLRREERDGRPPRHPRRGGGRGDARRAQERARPPADHRGGLPLRHRQDVRGAPRRVPSGRRGARQDAAGAGRDRREGRDRRPRPGHHRRDPARPGPLRRPAEAGRLLRHAARPGRDPQLAAALPGRRDADRPLAGGAPGAPGPAPRRGRRTDDGRGR